MQVSISLIEGVILLALSGLVTWLWFLHNRMTDIQLDLAKNYHSKDELRKIVEDALLPIWKEMERMARAMEKIGDDE